MNDSTSATDTTTKPPGIAFLPSFTTIAGANLVANGFNLLIGMYLVRQFTPDAYGQITYLLARFGFFRLLATAGMGSIVTIHIARSLRATIAHGSFGQESVDDQQDHQQLNRNYYSFLVIRIIVTGLLLLVSLVLMVVLDNTTYLVIALLLLPVSLGDFNLAVLQGNTWSIPVAVTLLSQPIAYALFAFILVQKHPSLTAVYAALVISYVISLCIGLIWVLKLGISWPRTKLIDLSLARSLRNILGSSFIIVLLQYSFSIATIYILGTMGLFAQSAQLGILLSLIFLPVGLIQIPIASVFQPRFVTLYDLQDPASSASFMAEFLLFVFRLTVLGTALCIGFASTIIFILYGDQYLTSAPSLVALSPLMVILCMEYIFVTTLLALHRPQKALPGLFIQLFLVASLSVLTIFVSEGFAGETITWRNVHSEANILLISIIQVFAATIGLAVIFRQVSHRIRVAWNKKEYLLAVIIASLAVLVGRLLFAWAPKTWVFGLAGLLVAALVYLAVIGPRVLGISMLKWGQKFRRVMLLGLFLALVALIRPSAAQAITGAAAVFSTALDCLTYYPDATATTAPSYAIIRCPYAGNADDNIIVYDRDGDMHDTGDWRTSTDFDGDLWVFDAGGDGAPNLIIDFHSTDGGLVAELYDDQNNDQRVAYEIRNGVPVITESEYPSLRFNALDGWWQQDEKINYNLNIDVDGPTRATFYTYDARFPNLKADGKPDYQIRIRDTDQNGRPDSEERQVLLPVSQGTGIHTELIVNTDHNEIPPAQDYLFWPYLGQPPDYIKPYGSGFPPVSVSWKDSRIKMLSEFVASRGQEANWFIYSSNSFGKPGQENANFENPFAFYDLAKDQDGYPELIIRNEYFDPHDNSFLQGFFSQPIETIRYSWNQNNDRSLDFKVDLVGRHAITDTVQLPDLRVRSIPYLKYPNWVIGKNWDAGHFVADENGDYFSTEGIYEGYLQEWRDYYVTGLTDNLFLDRLGNIRVGLRDEYTPELLQQPWLYFSPVDHRLHLQGAIGGIWNIDDQEYIHYADLDQDGYLDQWALVHRAPADTPESKETPLVETPLETLQVYDGLVLYSGEDQVRIVQSSVTSSLFQVLPPTDHAEWKALGERLEANKSAIPGDDLNAMASQYSGPATQIQGAKLEDFQAVNGQKDHQGFAFSLILLPDYQVISDELGMGVAGLPPGKYRVVFNGSYQIMPFTSPRLSLSPAGITFDPAQPQTSAWTRINATLQNSGSQEIKGLTARFYAGKPGQEPILLYGRQVNIPAEGETQLTANWWPVQTGDWQIWLQLNPEQLRALGVGIDGSSVASDTGIILSKKTIAVKPAQAPDMFRPLAPFDGYRFTWPVVGLLLAAGLATVSALWIFILQVRLAAVFSTAKVSTGLPSELEETTDSEG